MPNYQKKKISKMPKKSNFKEDLRIERKNIFVITDFSIITANVNIFRSSFIKKKWSLFLVFFDSTVKIWCSGRSYSVTLENFEISRFLGVWPGGYPEIFFSCFFIIMELGSVLQIVINYKNNLSKWYSPPPSHS